MTRRSSRRGGILFATLVAGPLFAANTSAASLYLRLPSPIVIRPSELMLVAPVAVLSIIVGCVLAILPNLVGTALLVGLGDKYPEARLPEFWTIAGAAIGIGITAATGAFQSPPLAFGLVATSAACAWICRRAIVWDDRAEANP